MLNSALFEEHVEQTHPEIALQSNIKALTRQCERAKISNEECPLCGCALASSEVKKHLAGHLQEIALFTLPNLVGDEKDEGRSERGQSSEETSNNNRGRRSLGSSVLEFESNPDHDRESSSGGGVTLLPIAAAKANPTSMIDVMKLLLLNGEDVDAMEKQCRVTALLFAVTGGDAEVVQLLLEKGANIEVRDTEHGLRPLHFAAQYDGTAAITKLLLENGANIDSRCSSQKRTALQYAAMNGCLEIVKLLLEHKADVNMDTSSRTALQAASEGGHLEAVKLLLEHKADVNAMPAFKNGRTSRSRQATVGSQGGCERKTIKLFWEHSSAGSLRGRASRSRQATVGSQGRCQCKTIKLFWEDGSAGSLRGRASRTRQATVGAKGGCQCRASIS